MPDHRVIAVDLGGTNIRTALCDEGGAILKRSRQLTHPEEGETAVLARIAAGIQAVMPDGGDAIPRVLGIGVASPGPIDPYSGVVLYASNLYWNDVPLRDRLREQTRLPVSVGNDANLAALGEQRYGAGRGIRDLAYITIGTGIGCGVILDDRLVLGHRGLATEVGHMVVNVDGEPIQSGVPGAFEGYAAGPGIARLAREKLASGQSSAMLDLAGGDAGKVTAREVGEAACGGDALALAVVQRTAYIIGLGFVNVLHLFNPVLIVVGGSVALMGDVLLDPVRETVERYAMKPYRGVPIVPAQLGDDCGLLGAAALAWKESENL
jgi:glucokinase